MAAHALLTHPLIERDSDNRLSRAAPPLKPRFGNLRPIRREAAGDLLRKGLTPRRIECLWYDNGVVGRYLRQIFVV